MHRQPARGLSCAAGRGYQFSVVYRWEFLALSSFVPTLLLLWIAIEVPGNSFVAVTVSEAIKLADEQFFV